MLLQYCNYLEVQDKKSIQGHEQALFQMHLIEKALFIKLQRCHLESLTLRKEHMPK